jgi:hypothetical protein
MLKMGRPSAGDREHEMLDIPRATLDGIGAHAR